MSSTSTSRIRVEIDGNSTTLQQAAVKGAESLKGLGNVLADQTGRAKALGEETVGTNQKVAASYAQTGRVAEASLSKASLRLQGYQVAVQSAENRVRLLSQTTAKGEGEQQKLNDALGLAQSRLSLAQNRLSAYTAQTGRATTEVQKHKGALQESGYALSGFSGQLGPLGRSLDLSARHAQLFREKGIDYLSLGVLGLETAFAGLSAKAAIGFEELTKNVGQQTGLTGKSLEDLMNVIRRVARDSPYQLKEVSDAAVVLRQQFHETDPQIESSANQMVAFAHAAGQEVRPEMQQLSRVMTDYREPLSKVTDLTDKLVAVSQATQQPIGSMVNAVDRFGPKLQALGFNLNDSVRLLALFTASGIKADQMGRGLASALSTASKAVQDGPAKLQQYALAVQSAQLRVDQLNQKVRAGTGDQRTLSAQLDIAKQKLSDAKTKYDGLNATLAVAKQAHGDIAAVVRSEMAEITHAHSRQDAYAKAIDYFGKNLGPSMARALYHNEGALKKVDAAMRNTGATQHLFSVDSHSLNGQLERAKNNFHDMEIAVGNKLLPALSKVVGWMRGAIGDVEKFVKHNQTLVEVLAGVATSLSAITILSRHTPLGFLTSKLPGPLGHLLSPGGGSGIFGARGALAPGSITNPIVVTVEGGRYSGLGSKEASSLEQGLGSSAGKGAAKETETAVQKAIRYGKYGIAAAPVAGGAALAGAEIIKAISGGAIDLMNPKTWTDAFSHAGFSQRGEFPGQYGGIQANSSRVTKIPLSAEQRIQQTNPYGLPMSGGIAGSHAAGTGGRTIAVDTSRMAGDLAKANGELDRLVSHQQSVAQTSQALAGLAREAMRTGDVRWGFGDSLGAELLRSRDVASKGARQIIAQLAQLPPGARAQAAQGMIAMTQELEGKGQLVTGATARLISEMLTSYRGGRDRGTQYFSELVTNASQEMQILRARIKTSTGQQRQEALAQYAQLQAGLGHAFGSMLSTVQTQTGKMTDAVSSSSHQAFQIGSKNFGLLSQNIAQYIGSGAEATQTGLQNITDQINAVLTSYGEAKLSPAQVKTATPAQLAAVFTGQVTSGGLASPHAGGGFVGSPGERGRDEVPIVVGRGEAILNHPQQQVVNQALAAQGIGGLPEVFSKVTASHYMAQGGFAGGAAGQVKPLPYVFPYGPGLAQGRTDQGTDWTGAGQIGAIGAAHILQATTSNSGWPGGGFILYQLKDGPKAGAFVYLAENIQPEVSAGQDVAPGQAIAFARGAFPWTESGWATSAGNTLASAQGNTGDAAHNNAPAGIDFTNFIMGLKHGVITGGGAFGGAAPPKLQVPEVIGGGVEGKMVKAGLKKVVDAANRYIAAHAPSVGSAGGALGPVSAGPAPKGGLKWEVKAVQESSDLAANSGAGAFGPLTGYSELGNPLGVGVGNALGRLPGMTEMWISANGKTVKSPLVDIGTGSTGPEWTSYPQLVMGLYPQTSDALGLSGGGPYMVDIGRVDGGALSPAQGIALHGLGGYAGLEERFANGGQAGVRHSTRKNSGAAAKKAPVKKPGKPKHVKPPKLPKLPKLKDLPGFDQGLLDAITATADDAGAWSNWQGYLESLHQMQVAATIQNADGTSTVNPGLGPWPFDPSGYGMGQIGQLTGLPDPTTGQQTKGIWDRLREIGAPGQTPPGSIARDKTTELGVDALILDDLLKEQYQAAVAAGQFGPWLANMTAAVASGGKEVDWLGRALDPTVRWGALGGVNFHSIDPAGNLVTTTGQIYQVARGADGKLHFQLEGNKMGPEIKRRAHEYKNLLAQIERATKLKEKLPLQKEKRLARIKTRIDEAKHKIDISSITSTFSSGELLSGQQAALEQERKAALNDIKHMPGDWKGDRKTWAAQHAIEASDLNAEFDARKAALRKAHDAQKLAGRVKKSDALFALGKESDAERLAVDQSFGARKNQLSDLIRGDTTVEGADKAWLKSWLSKLTAQHGTESGALAQAPDFKTTLAAYTDPRQGLATSVLGMQNVTIPNLLREISTLTGTTVTAATAAAGAGAGDNSVLLGLQQQLNLQLSQALALNEAQTRALSSMIPEIPAYEQGGPVIRDTLAYVHEGEHVVPKDGALVMRDSGGNAGSPIVIEHHWHGDAAALRDFMDARIAHPDNVRVVSKQVGRRASMLAGAPGGFR